MDNDSHAPLSSTPEFQQEVNERANFCFGCGPNNPEGLHLVFTIDAANPERITATAPVNLTRLHEGPPGHIHGGIIATLMDEAMGKLNRPLDVIAMTRHMSVDYLRPSPLGVDLTLVATHLRREGRKLFNQAELLHADGSVLARATGVFLAIDPGFLQLVSRRAMAED